MADLRYVLDANIISDILRKNKTVVKRVALALADNAYFLLCPVVFYEIQRGLLYRDAKKQLSLFLKYTNTFVWEDITREDWQMAAQHWADLRVNGYQIGDADLLIGTYAIRRNATIITDNEKHFLLLNAKVENWRR